MYTQILNKKPLNLLKIFVFSLFILGSSTTFQSCSLKYDMIGSQNISNLATKIPALMGKATGKYSDNESAVNSILSEIDNAYTHASSIAKNTDVSNQWSILKNDLAQPYFDKWKNSGQLNAEFVNESVSQMKASLNAIQKTENSKKK